MALTEQRVLSQVTRLLLQDAVNVQWEDQIVKDGEVIHKTPHRKAYTRAQKEEFLAEVEGAASDVAILGW